MPMSTVQRLVTNLTSQGFLDREDDSYRIGLRMAFWAAPATRGMEVVDVLSPLLKTLRDTPGETSRFFKSEQHSRGCVAMPVTNRVLRREMQLGKIAPLYAGSAGLDNTSGVAQPERSPVGADTAKLSQ
ncbi:hypothetical protein [Pseudarthrobacter sp. NBSH8]|uniref:hypothetical protein n=1 Tax=Pseudarthrobacter sp. NBSH8 TaxID=2596911 RepID=UPI0021039083|nr:hypothetical protein [Pseudarthrobacter sp. NBSH8]